MFAQPTYPSVEIAGVQAAVGVLSSKWSVAILAELSGGTRRFNELLRAIDGISRRMLAATLRRLEQDGLIARRVYADVPVRVEYDLTRSGAALFAALTPLSAWSLQHLPPRPRFTRSTPRIEGRGSGAAVTCCSPTPITGKAERGPGCSMSGP